MAHDHVRRVSRLGAIVRTQHNRADGEASRACAPSKWVTIGETDDLDMAKCRISMILTTMLRRDLDKSFHVPEGDVAVV